MSFFAKLSIAKKLGLGFSFLLLMLGFLGVFSLQKLDVVNGLTNEMADNWVPSIAYTGGLNTGTSDFRVAELQHILATRPEDMRAYESEMAKVLKEMKETATKYEPLITSPEERKLYNEFQASWGHYLKEHEKVLELSNQSKQEEARVIATGSSQKLFDQACKNLVELVTLNSEGASKASIRGDEIYAATVKIVWSLVIGSFLFGATVAVFTTRSITGPLSKVMTEMGMGAQQVTTASEQLSEASQELSSSASEAAASLEETVASLEELNSIVSTNANNAQEASRLSSQCVTEASKGETSITDLNMAMEEIAKSSKRIEEIINVIDDIAFQTNLLALNAAVEAARAGEQGKGFAVVAEAVRNLAQRSAEAAKDITSLIKDSGGKTVRGAELALENRKVFAEIVQSVTKVSDLNKEISMASQEQSKGLTQISQAMNQMDQATQTNAATAEESASASEELSAQAISLMNQVEELRQVISGYEAKLAAQRAEAAYAAPTAAPTPIRSASKPGRNAGHSKAA